MSQNIFSQTDLQDTIRRLEAQRKIEGRELKRQLELTYESIKPINLIKSTLKEVTNSDGLKESLISSSLGLAAGMLSKMLFVGFSRSPVRRLLGTVLMFGVTNLVSKNSEALYGVGRGFLNLVDQERSDSEDKPQVNHGKSHAA